MVVRDIDHQQRVVAWYGRILLYLSAAGFIFFVLAAAGFAPKLATSPDEAANDSLLWKRLLVIEFFLSGYLVLIGMRRCIMDANGIAWSGLFRSTQIAWNAIQSAVVHRTKGGGYKFQIVGEGRAIKFELPGRAGDLVASRVDSELKSVGHEKALRYVNERL